MKPLHWFYSGYSGGSSLPLPGEYQETPVSHIVFSSHVQPVAVHLRLLNLEYRITALVIYIFYMLIRL